MIDPRARQLIMQAEGLRLEAYVCPAGKLTIGYGHTLDVKRGQVITWHQAEVIFEHDLDEFEQAVAKLAPGATVPQLSAMVSLAYNIGLTRFAGSTLLREFLAGRPLLAAAEFLKWTHAAGKVLPGLVKRRAAERALFLEVPS